MSMWKAISVAVLVVGMSVTFCGYLAMRKSAAATLKETLKETVYAGMTKPDVQAALDALSLRYFETHRGAADSTMCVIMDMPGSFLRGPAELQVYFYFKSEVLQNYTVE